MDSLPIEQLPDIVMSKVLGYLSFDQVAKLRLVNRYFDQICRRHLNLGFQRVEKIQSQYLKDLKSKLPRRESARRNHKYAKHCDILTAIDTRMNLLSMTFGKYIDANLCCFIPGKIIDEIYNVLGILKTKCDPPSTYEVLQELRDISSMAMEYFDDKIAPGLLRKHHNITSTSSATVSSMMTMTSSVLMTPASVSSALFSSPITTSTPISRASRIRDELLTHKKQTMEMVVRQTQKHVKKAVNRAMQRQREKIDKLEQLINNQASLIESQDEMLKDMNKKILENEQKLADFVTAKDVVGRKRPASDNENNLTENNDHKNAENPSSSNNDKPAAKKIKPS